MIIIFDRKQKRVKFDRQRDNGDQRRDVVKIGREINRYKQLDGANKAEIKRRFEKDANKLFERKMDNTLDKKIAREVVERMKRR